MPNEKVAGDHVICEALATDEDCHALGGLAGAFHLLDLGTAQAFSASHSVMYIKGKRGTVKSMLWTCLT